MKKIFLLLTIFLVLSCSSNENSAPANEEITSINQFWGNWNLIAINPNGSTSNIATECDLQYGKFIFSSPNLAIQKFGYMDGICSNESITYDEYLIVDGQLKLFRGNYEYRYNVSKQGNNLWLTKYYTRYNGGTPVLIPTSDQKTYCYNKQ